MSANRKQAQKLARQLFRLSLGDTGAVSPERVSGVLQYIEKHRPANAMAALRLYERLISREMARSHAIVEHAGSVSNAMLKGIATSLTQSTKRPITAEAKANPSLIAGLRVRLGDDVFENSVANRLATLAEAC
jgi:F-type H+-transporting ATPase subunit delta